MLDRGDLLDQPTTQSDSRRRWRGNDPVCVQPLQDCGLVQSEVEALVRLQQAEDRMSGAVTDLNLVEQTQSDRELRIARLVAGHRR